MECKKACGVTPSTLLSDVNLCAWKSVMVLKASMQQLTFKPLQLKQLNAAANPNLYCMSKLFMITQ